MSNPPTMVFTSGVSRRRKKARSMAMATDNLSTGATFDTGPDCNALK